MPSGVKTAKVDYSDPDSLTAALHGIDALIITMSVFAPEEQQYKLIDAAAAAGVPWILPNEWGINNADPEFGKDVLIGPRNQGYRDHIEKVGKSSWIGVSTGFWYEWSLGGGPGKFGVDFREKTMTFYDDGTCPMNISSWPQTGLATAKLLSLPILPADADDQATTLSHFRNSFCVVTSFLLTQRDMFASVLRVTGTTEKDWKVDSEPVKERYAAGMKQMRGGDRNGFGKLLYARPFYPDEPANFEKAGRLDNERLGLEKEDEVLDEYTRQAVEWDKEGRFDAFRG